MIQGVAAACLAWLVLTGVVYLVVFLTRLNRLRGEHGWLAAQSLLAAAYPLWTLGGGGAVSLAELGAALALACAASVAFTHAHFALRAPGRTWWALAVLGCVAGGLGRLGLVSDAVIAAVTLLVIGGAVAHQVEALGRLARTDSPPLNAHLLLGAWTGLAGAVALDVARWGAAGGPPGGRAHLSASLVGLTALAFLYTVALARQHGVSLEQAERQSRELAARLSTIEAKSREIDSLNQELRRQIGLRSRQLSAALATLGARAGGLATGAEIAGRYRVLGHVGTGGMGIVYEVERRTDGRRCALKLLAGHAQPQIVARFAREAEILSQLHHPNLVEILDIDVSADGQLFLVMELVDGVSLAIACDAARDLAWRVQVLTEVAAGLVAIHSAGIVHRDLKPANILIADAPDGCVVKIADFGVSSFDPQATPGDGADERRAMAPIGGLTSPGVILGTPRYLAPELVSGAQTAAFPVDVFSFGVLAYELLTGQLPYPEHAFVRRLHGLADEEPPPVVALAPGVPPALAALVHDCLALDRAARPSSAEVLARLRALPAMPSLALPSIRVTASGPTVAYGELTAETRPALAGC